MQILVTGASGRLGAHLSTELAGLAMRPWPGAARGGDARGSPLRRVDLGDRRAVQRRSKRRIRTW